MIIVKENYDFSVVLKKKKLGKHFFVCFQFITLENILKKHCIGYFYLQLPTLSKSCPKRSFLNIIFFVKHQREQKVHSHNSAFLEKHVSVASKANTHVLHKVCPST